MYLHAAFAQTLLSFLALTNSTPLPLNFNRETTESSTPKRENSIAPRDAKHYTQGDKLPLTAPPQPM